MAEAHKHPDKVTSTHFRRGEDGVHFVDYLRGACEDVLHTSEEFEQILNDHKDVAIKKLRELSVKSDKTRQKSLWLALYHNSTVNLLRNGNGEGDDHIRPVMPPEFDALDTPSLPLDYEPYLIPENLLNEIRSGEGSKLEKHAPKQPQKS